MRAAAIVLDHEIKADCMRAEDHFIAALFGGQLKIRFFSPSITPISVVESNLSEEIRPREHRRGQQCLHLISSGIHPRLYSYRPQVDGRTLYLIGTINCFCDGLTLDPEDIPSRYNIGILLAHVRQEDREEVIRKLKVVFTGKHVFTFRKLNTFISRVRQPHIPPVVNVPDPFVVSAKRLYVFDRSIQRAINDDYDLFDLLLP